MRDAGGLALEQRVAQRIASEVAQIFNLLYRRIAFGKPLDVPQCSRLFPASQIPNLRYGRVQLCATVRPRAAAFVAQIFNLLYRRIVFGKPSGPCSALKSS